MFRDRAQRRQGIDLQAFDQGAFGPVPWGHVQRPHARFAGCQRHRQDSLDGTERAVQG